MKRKTPLTTVRTHRRRWAFTQKEVADLLGFEDRTCVSRIEQGKRVPSLETALALEALFGVAPKTLFPHTYAEAEEALMRRAVVLYEATFDNSSLRQQRKRDALEQALKRATDSPNVEGV